MTESEWLSCTDPMPMLNWLHSSGKASDRKMRLFTVACCRRIWHLLEDERSREAVLVAEKYADGLVAEKERSIAAEQARAVDPSERNDAAFAAYMTVDDNSLPDSPTEKHRRMAAWGLALETYGRAAYADPGDIETRVVNGSIFSFPLASVREAHSQFLRDIFGNPFRAMPSIDSAWLTPRVVTLARAIYDERTFGRMPELADGLEASGCQYADLLAHCRSQADHVRGCCVIDAVLGKG